MVRDALDAFLTADANLARPVLKSDDAVDNLNSEIFEVLDFAMTHRRLRFSLALPQNGWRH